MIRALIMMVRTVVAEVVSIAADVDADFRERPVVCTISVSIAVAFLVLFALAPTLTR